MIVLIAPDKFKGSLSAHAVCESISRGIQMKDKTITCWSHPMADGGEGSLDILSSHLDFTRIEVLTVDALNRAIIARYCRMEDSAFIELSSASGLMLLDEQDRNPRLTSTIGTGFMIRHAIDHGAKKIYLFLGGSATNDGGMGIAHALGVKFLDERNHTLSPIGEHLFQVNSIDTSAMHDYLSKIEIIALCDVDNPFYGMNGAAHVYASQKGANEKDIEYLDRGLKHFAACMLDQLHIEVQSLKGSGAAGGAAGGIVAMLGARLESGSQVIAQLSGLEEKIKTADVILTGEGKIDHQTLQGKAVSEVARLANKYHKPCWIFAGQNTLTHDQILSLEVKGISTLFDAAQGDMKKAMMSSDKLLEQMAFDWVNKLGLL